MQSSKPVKLAKAKHYLTVTGETRLMQVNIVQREKQSINLLKKRLIQTCVGFDKKFFAQWGHLANCGN